MGIAAVARNAPFGGAPSRRIPPAALIFLDINGLLLRADTVGLADLLAAVLERRSGVEELAAGMDLRVSEMED